MIRLTPKSTRTDPLFPSTTLFRSLLPDLDIAKADLRQHRHFVADGGNGLEEFHRVFHRHVQHVGDGHALELYFEGFAIVARAVADVAGDIDVRTEVHFDLQHAVALTGSLGIAYCRERVCRYG